MQLKLLMLCMMCLGQGIFMVMPAQTQVSLDLPYISSDTIFKYQDNIQGKQHPRWYLINVLPSDICSECFIPGSINIPTHKLEKKLSNSKKWPRDLKIVLYCAGGICPLSKYAYDIVKKLGFIDVQILAGGIIEWVAHKLPVEGSCALHYLK